MNKFTNILHRKSLNYNQIIVNGSFKYRWFSNQEEKIEIPKRISREPTDILRALESTVSRDLTAAHYKYHDDPYLIPMSNIGKRTFALAQESGRKAAHWVREQHHDLFQHRECDPPIKLFFPKMVYGDKAEVTQDDLKSAIDDVLVSDAILVYNLLKTNKAEISEEVLIAFLDLLCYFNSEDSLPVDFIEERWFMQGNKSKQRLRNTWKDGALAEEIFISLENPGAQAYSAIIQGMAKHYQVNRAWQLFEEAQAKSLILNIGAYNAIISVANFLKEGYDLRWNLITDILSIINSTGVKPNLGTLNATLEIISTMGMGKNNKQNALRILKEFQNLGIEPSLGSWYYVLITFCKDRGPISFILKDILPHVENREHKIRDMKDTFFFVTAMDICRNHLHDKNLGKRVNQLLHYGNNYDLIGNSFKESIYYRHYFILMCETEPLDEFMRNYYEKLVPHIYVPEPGVMMELLKTVEINAAIEYLPKLWSDMIIFNHIDRENLLNTVLNIMVHNKPKNNDELSEQFSNIAWDIWNKVENQDEHRTKMLQFTGEMLGNIMTVVLGNNDFEKASHVMNKLDVITVPNIEALSLFIDYCITEKNPSKAVQCVQYCADCGFSETNELATKLYGEMEKWSKEMQIESQYFEKVGKIMGKLPV